MVHSRNLWFDTLDAYFSNLLLEERMLGDFEFVMLHELGVARARMLQIKVGRLLHIVPNRLSEPYRDRLDAAETSGLITYEEELELRRADIVAHG